MKTKDMNPKTMARNAVNYIVLSITCLFALVAGKSKASARDGFFETGAPGPYARNDRYIDRTPKGIPGNDFESAPQRDRTYLGQCVGPDVCYFIGDIKMYNLITEAARRAGLENPFRYFRVISNFDGGGATLRTQTKRA